MEIGPALSKKDAVAEVRRGAILWQLRASTSGHWEIWSLAGRQWICAEWAGRGDLYDFAAGTAFLEGMVGGPLPLPSEVIEALADELLKTKGRAAGSSEGGKG